MDLMESIAEEQGICCNSCQENVNIHYCASCGKRFYDGDAIFCKQHSQTDCEHFHRNCKPKSDK